MTETGLKAAQPLSKMPTEIWRFCAGQRLLPRALPEPAPAQPTRKKRRLYPLRVRRLRLEGIASAGVEVGPETTGLRILIVTDAWAPQVNGVVRTLEMLGRDLRALGNEVQYATPAGRFTFPL